MRFRMTWANPGSVVVIWKGVHFMENTLEDDIASGALPIIGNYHYDSWNNYRDTYVAFELADDAMLFIAHYTAGR